MFSGIMAVLLASLLFGILPSGNKYMLLSGMSETCLVLYQSGVMTAAAFLLALMRRESLRIPFLDGLRLILLGGIGMYTTDLLLNIAYTHLPVSLVIMLNFLYPTIVLAISVAVFHQKLSALNILAMCCGIAGLLCVTDLQSGGMDMAGVLLALGSGMTYAIFVTANEHDATAEYPLPVRLFYMSFSSTVIALIQTAVNGSFSLPAHALAAADVIVVVGIGSVLAFYLVMLGIQKIGAERTSILNMLEPIAAVFFSVLLFREPFTGRIAAGGMMILISVFLIALDGVRGKSRGAV